MRGFVGLAVVVAAACAHTPALPHRDVFFASLPNDAVTPAGLERKRLEGQVVLVTFIATWCFPCLTDLATLDKLERDFGNAGLTQLLVGMDLEGRKVLEPFAAQLPKPWPLLVADERLRSGRTPFGLIRELPARVLFDRDGQVIAAYSGVVAPRELERKVREALGR